MLTAINCGDDTDCTAATVGATLGILGGTNAIPEDWEKHIGDDIITVSINRGYWGNSVPRTCTDLAKRVIAQAPYMLFVNHAPVSLVDGDTEIPEDTVEILKSNEKYNAYLSAVKQNTVTFESAFVTAIVSYDGDPEISPNGEKKIHFQFRKNYNVFDYASYNLNLRWWLPDGFSVEGGRKTLTLTPKDSLQTETCDLDVTIKAGDTVDALSRCVLEVTATGRSIPLYIPIVLLG